MNNDFSTYSLRHGLAGPLTLVALLSVGAIAPAQDASLPNGQAPQQAQTAGAIEGMFRVPLQQDELDAQQLWASGDTYKVGFRRSGMQFVPVLGPDAPVSRPLNWRTLRVGDTTIEANSAELQHTDWRVELRHQAGFVEAYDVLPNGVEQTFVFAAPPTFDLRTNTLAIEGAIESSLHAKPRGAAHEAIAFCDELGNPVVQYGRAFAFDATGDRIELATGYDGKRISIEVPTAWLQSATYPVVVDPLTSRSTLVNPNNNGVYCPQTARDLLNDRMIVGYSRSIAANDYDAYVRAMTADYAALGFIYYDLGNDSVKEVSVAWVRQGNTWVVAAGKHDQNVHTVRIHLHPTSSINTSGGQNLTVPQLASFSHSRPVVGGSVASSPVAYVAYERDLGQPDGSLTKIWGAVIDTANATIAPASLLVAQTAVDTQRPSISSRTSSSTDWVVAYQRKNGLPNDDWDVWLTKVNGQGNVSATVQLPIGNSNGLHSFQPKVDGSAGTFYIAYLTRPLDGTPIGMTGTRLNVQRIRWTQSAATPYVPSSLEYVVDSHPTSIIELHDGARPIAVNESTSNHFVVAWRRLGDFFGGRPTKLMATRYGYDDVPLETHELESDASLISPYGPVSVHHDLPDRSFPLTYGGIAFANNAVYGRKLDQPNASANPYGGTCGGNLTSGIPYAGYESYRIKLAFAAPDTATWLWAALAPGNLPLPGLTNCAVLLDVQAAPIIVDQSITTAGGVAYFQFPLPSSAAGIDLYFQAMQLQLGSDFDMSDGLQVLIR